MVKQIRRFRFMENLLAWKCEATCNQKRNVSEAQNGNFIIIKTNFSNHKLLLLLTFANNVEKVSSITLRVQKCLDSPENGDTNFGYSETFFA